MIGPIYSLNLKIKDDDRTHLFIIYKNRTYVYVYINQLFFFFPRKTATLIYWRVDKLYAPKSIFFK